ncbi:MAG: MFS transporter [Dehalococcoidia bacterium]
MRSETSPRRKIFGLHPNVFFLGLVSFFTDASSELTMTILPLFLANVLGVGPAIIGLIEGVAESTATILKVVSGWLSDRLGRRKPLAVLGYGLSTLAKPFLYLAGAWPLVLAVRFTDRLGKGIRTSPRDALVADSSSQADRGKSFGFHRALDSLGAVLGLAVAAAIVYQGQRGALELTRDTYQKLVPVGVVPAVVAVLLLLLFVREVRGARKRQEPPEWTASPPPGPSTAFGGRFKVFLAITVVFTLGNSSDAFLILRAQNLGISTFNILLLLVMFNLVNALVSLPAGLISDRWGRRVVIIFGWAVYGLIYLGFALVQAPGQVAWLFALYGVYHGAVEGVSRAYVADMVPEERRGTAYGLYHGAVGVTALPASLIAGWLWQTVDPSAPFFLGAALALLAAVSLWALVK